MICIKPNNYQINDTLWVHFSEKVDFKQFSDSIKLVAMSLLPPSKQGGMYTCVKKRFSHPKRQEIQIKVPKQVVKRQFKALRFKRVKTNVDNVPLKADTKTSLDPSLGPRFSRIGKDVIRIILEILCAPQITRNISRKFREITSISSPKIYQSLFDAYMKDPVLYREIKFNPIQEVVNYKVVTVSNPKPEKVIKHLVNIFEGRVYCEGISHHVVIQKLPVFVKPSTIILFDIPNKFDPSHLSQLAQASSIAIIFTSIAIELSGIEREKDKWRGPSHRSTAEWYIKMYPLSEPVTRSVRFQSWMENHKDDMSKVKELECKNRGIHFLPRQIGLLTNLQWLRLPHNSISDFPTEFWHLKQLVILNLRFNKLEKISSLISNLINLQIIWLDGNLLTELPGEIGLLPNLEILSIMDNPFMSLPRSLGPLHQSEILVQDHHWYVL